METTLAFMDPKAATGLFEPTRRDALLDQSLHTVLVLANLDNHFDETPACLEDCLVTGEIQPAEGNHDLVLFGQTNIYQLIQNIAATTGLFSSRTLILNRQITKKEQLPATHSGILLFDSMHGRENLVFKALSKLKGIYAVYEAHGIYQGVALVSFENEAEFKQQVNDVSDIRIATLLQTPKPLNIVGVVKEAQPIITLNYLTSNAHEGTNYHPDTDVNKDYARGCIEMAQALLHQETEHGRVYLLYAPLRGAKPIVDALFEAYRLLPGANHDCFTPNVLFPVTSSFVFYSPKHPYVSKKGKKPASGRATNVLELQRILKRNQFLTRRMMYIDEIVSGGMLYGHVKEMLQSTRGVLRDRVVSGSVNLTVFGLAHAYGKKIQSGFHGCIQRLQEHTNFNFFSFPIKNLVTEDQRYLLGLHYLYYMHGPHVVPFVRPNREYHLERTNFLHDISTAVTETLLREARTH